jgi:hypothetical protein
VRAWFEDIAFLKIDDYFYRGAAPSPLLKDFCDAIYETIDSRLRTRLVVDVVSSVDDKRMEMVPSKTIFESINAYVYLAKIDLLGLVERIQALGATKVVFLS